MDKKNNIFINIASNRHAVRLLDPRLAASDATVSVNFNGARLMVGLLILKHVRNEGVVEQ